MLLCTCVPITIYSMTHCLFTKKLLRKIIQTTKSTLHAWTGNPCAHFIWDVLIYLEDRSKPEWYLLYSIESNSLLYTIVDISAWKFFTKRLTVDQTTLLGKFAASKLSTDSNKSARASDNTRLKTACIICDRSPTCFEEQVDQFASQTRHLLVHRSQWRDTLSLIFPNQFSFCSNSQCDVFGKALDRAGAMALYHTFHLHSTANMPCCKPMEWNFDHKKVKLYKRISRSLKAIRKKW